MNTGILGGNRSHIGRESYLGVNEKNYRKGFTLVELIVVLVILAILAAIAVPVALGFVDKANDRKIIKNGEVSLTASQTVLNQVYNEGVGRLAMTKRAAAHEMAKKAATDSGDLDDGTEFMVWTAKALLDGTTKATDEHVASFQIQYALLKTLDGKFAFYDSKEWKVYDSAEKLMANATYASLTGQENRKIVIWPQPASGRDLAYDPDSAYAEDGEENWVDDDDIYVTGESISLIVKGKVENANVGSNVWFSDTKAESVLIPYDGKTSLEELLEAYELRINARYDETSLKWEYASTPIVPRNTAEMDQFLKSHLEDFVSAGITVEITATMGHKVLSVPVSFSAYRDTLTVDANVAAYEYDLVTMEKQSADLAVAVASAVDGDSARADKIATFNGKWLVNNSDEDGKFDFAKENNEYRKISTGDLNGVIQTYAEGCINPYLENGTEPTGLKFVATADIHKTVYMWAIDPETNKYSNTHEVKFGGAESYSLTLQQNELENTYVRDASGKAMYSYTQNGIRYEGDYASYNADNAEDFLVKASNYAPEPLTYTDPTKKVTANKLKYWYGFDCDKDGQAVVTNSPVFERTRGDFSKDVLKRLYDSQNPNYGEFVGIDVSNMNSRLISNAKVESYTGTQDYAKLKSYFGYLVNDLNYVKTYDLTKISTELDGWMPRINNVYCVDKEDKPGYNDCYKEICISTTVPKKKEDGKYDLDGEPETLDSEYPAYIIAYSVGNINDGFNIYIFTEDDTDMKAENSLQGLFMGCTGLLYNDFITRTDLSGVTRTKELFSECNSLKNINLYRFADVNSTDATSMFQNCSDCTFTNIDCFDTSKLIYMRNMFDGCTKFPETYTLNVTNAKAMDYAFRGCEALETITIEGAGKNVPNGLGDINNASITGNKCIEGIFTGCSSLTTINISGINADKITSLSNFFNDSSVKQHVTTINISDVTFSYVSTLKELFKGYEALNSIVFTNSDMPLVTNTSSMFSGCTALETVELCNLGNITDMSYMFQDCSSLESADVAPATTSATNMKYMFKGCTSLKSGDSGLTIHIDNANDISFMFSGCSGLTNITFDGGENGAPNLRYVNSVTAGCTGITDLTIKNIVQEASNTNKITTLSPFVTDCKPALKNVTFENLVLPGVTSMADMFLNATSLQTAVIDLEAEKTTLTSGMFYGCRNLTYVDISEFYAPLNTSTNNMFRNCINLENSGVVLKKGNDKSFNVDNVTAMTNMFAGCEKLTDLVEPELLHAKNMSSMYAGCTDIGKGKDKDEPIVFIVHSDIEEIPNIFEGCTSLKAITFEGRWRTDEVPSSVDSTGCVLKNDKSKDVFKNTKIEALHFKNLYFLSYSNTNGKDDVSSGLHNILKGVKDAKTLQKITFDHVSAPGIKSASQLLLGCTDLVWADLSGLKLENNEITRRMFYECESLTGITDDTHYLNIDGIVTNKVSNTQTMFGKCTGLLEFKVKSFDTSRSGIDMQWMFQGCSKVKTIYLNSKATNAITKEMFDGCGSLETIYAVENFTVKGGSSADMFRNCSKIKGGAGTTYLDSSPQYARIDGGNSKPGYFTSLP